MATDPAHLLILAAGLGRRYGGLKQIEPVGPSGETILDYSVADAIRAGFDAISLVVRAEIEEEIRAFVSTRFATRIRTTLVLQNPDDPPSPTPPPEGRSRPWGTGHAVLAARDAIDSPFAVINADDFYGADAFRALHAFLSTARERPPTAHAMVGYRLRQTLSAHGAVARGICTVAPDGALVTVAERLGILPEPGGDASCEDGAGARMPLDGDTVVSLNLWGFTPAIFPELLRLYAEFRAGPRGADPEAEFFLPDAIDRLMREGRASVQVLPTGERWFGVTHRQDRAAAVEAIRERIARGLYPPRLWG